MTPPQQLLILFYGIINFLAFLKGYYEIKDKKNPYGLAQSFGLLGIFVWGDAVVIGPFWIIISVFSLVLQDWYLFLVALSLFWVVRSAVEVVYWVFEQFTERHRNHPQTLMFYNFIKSDAIWFIYQIFWQCILVISILASIYFTTLWLQPKF